jgi:hypothetical protein
VSAIAHAAPSNATATAPSSETSLRGVIARGVLRGLTVQCAPKLTLLLDADGEGPGLRPAACALRMLAGVDRPSAGVVRALGADPARDPKLRRDIALLGDDVLLEEASPLEDAVITLARVRGVEELTRRDRVRAIVAEHESPLVARKTLSDRLAAPERARLVLVSHPERWSDASARDRLTRAVNDALDRGVQVVLATTRLDDWLHVARSADATAVLLAAGVAVASGPAHGLPWAVPTDGTGVRVVRVAVKELAHRLASELFADDEIAPTIVAVETVSPTELRVHTRDPRALSRSIARRAADGLEVRKLVVQGATALALAEAFAGGRRR